MNNSRASLSTRGLLLLVLSLGVVSVALPRASVPAAQKGSAKTVFASALDANDNAVTGMGKEEWGVREDGTNRDIVDVKPATQPLDIVLMIDTSKSVAINVNELRDGVKSFTHKILAGNPGASFSIMNVASAAVMVSKDLKTPEDVDKILSKTYPDQTEPTVFLEGVVDASKKLMKSATPRRAIVIVNLEGVPEISSLKIPEVLQPLLQSGASLWALSYSSEVTKRLIAASTKGGIGSANTGQQRDIILENAPRGTGGFRLKVEVPTAIEQGLSKVADALLGQYEITYTRPEGPMPKQLQVGNARMQQGVRISNPAAPPK
jgi:hypothetical protein